MARRPSTRMRAECSCGTIVEGPRDEAAQAMVRHAREVHGRELSVDQARRMLHPA
ncbi:MAG: hypothetical protein ACO3S5_09965 [Ilumatobacteraceae bacterium]